MTTPRPPLLMQSGLTGRVYIVTAYRFDNGGHVVAKAKTDVTAEFEAIEAQRAATRKAEE